MRAVIILLLLLPVAGCESFIQGARCIGLRNELREAGFDLVIIKAAEAGVCAADYSGGDFCANAKRQLEAQRRYVYSLRQQVAAECAAAAQVQKHMGRSDSE